MENTEDPARTVQMLFPEEAEFDAVKYRNALRTGMKLRPGERCYALQRFDAAFDALFMENQRKLLARAGLDLFDLIFVGKQSAGLLYVRKYRNIRGGVRVERMKLEIIAAAFDPGKTMAVTWIQEDGEGCCSYHKPLPVVRRADPVYPLHDPELTGHHAGTADKIRLGSLFPGGGTYAEACIRDAETVLKTEYYAEALQRLKNYRINTIKDRGSSI